MNINVDFMLLAKLKCIDSLTIYGRNPDGSPDHCFKEGREYLFCFDTKKGELFTYNDVKEMHFFSFSDYFTDKHFSVIEINKMENFGLDQFDLARYRRMFKDKGSYSE
ncbi:hypothetical protein ACFVQB_14125 [Paenibacillus sp. NPDC057886]|uniref:hypothetical protein n=1 Tax=Paenibacillus sp. NPDC057886 TaxID=3346270 RepID=UPI0036B4EE62